MKQSITSVIDCYCFLNHTSLCCSRRAIDLRYITDLCRIYDIENCLLRARTLQWAGIVHCIVQRVPGQRPICFLGCISSIGKGEPVRCSGNSERWNRVHEPHEPQHHFGFGFQDLNIIYFPFQTTYISMSFHFHYKQVLYYTS